jgi:hypothetical protein
VFKYITEGLSAAMELFSASITSIKSLNRTDQVEAGSSCLNSSKDLTDEILTASVANVERGKVLQTCCRLTVRELTRTYNSFLYNHLCVVPTPLKNFRHFLDDALELFPEDPRLLNTFIDLETAGCISLRLRSYFHRSVTMANSPIPFLYAVLSERKRMFKLLAANDSQVSGKLSQQS